MCSWGPKEALSAPETLEGAENPQLTDTGNHIIRDPEVHLAHYTDGETQAWEATGLDGGVPVNDCLRSASSMPGSGGAGSRLTPTASLDNTMLQVGELRLRGQSTSPRGGHQGSLLPLRAFPTRQRPARIWRGRPTGTQMLVWVKTSEQGNGTWAVLGDQGRLGPGQAVVGWAPHLPFQGLEGNGNSSASISESERVA